CGTQGVHQFSGGHVAQHVVRVLHGDHHREVRREGAHRVHAWGTYHQRICTAVVGDRHISTATDVRDVHVHEELEVVAIGHHRVGGRGARAVQAANLPGPFGLSAALAAR